MRQIYALGGQKIKKYLEKLVQFIIQIALYRNLGLNPGLNFLGLALVGSGQYCTNAAEEMQEKW